MQHPSHHHQPHHSTPSSATHAAGSSHHVHSVSDSTSLRAGVVPAVESSELLLPECSRCKEKEEQHIQAMHVIQLKHASDHAESSRSSQRHLDDTIARIERLHSDALVETRFQMEAGMKNKLHAESTKNIEKEKQQMKDEIAALKAALELKEHTLQSLHMRSEKQSIELHKAHQSTHRLQTAVDLINRQIRFAEDWKTLLKYMTVKLYIVQYKQYKSSKETHRAVSEMIKNVSAQEKKSWMEHHASHTQSTATTPHMAASATVPPSPGLNSLPSLVDSSSDQSTTASSNSIPSKSVLFSSTPVTFREFVSTASIAAPSSSSSYVQQFQNETAAWLHQDRLLWNNEKTKLNSLSILRKERNEKIEYKLQYTVKANPSTTTVTATGGMSQSSCRNEYLRLRLIEKKIRAIDEGETTRIFNVFNHFNSKRNVHLMESLPILSIAFSESFERESNSFQTTKLFQSQNTQLLNDFSIIQSSKYSAQLQANKWKKKLEQMQIQLDEALEKVCICSKIAGFRSAEFDSNGQMKHLCLCDCVEDCACNENTKAQQQLQQQQQQQPISFKVSEYVDDEESKTECVEPVNSDVTSSDLQTTPRKNTLHPSRSLATLTPYFATSLGSGRNARTHAVLNEHSNHLNSHTDGSSTPRLTHSLSAAGLNSPESGAAANASYKQHPTTHVHDVQSVPWLQRVIKNLRARLYAARTSIINLQAEIVEGNLRKANNNQSDDAQQHKHTQLMHHSNHAYKHGSLSDRVLLDDSLQSASTLGFGSRTARFHADQPTNNNSAFVSNSVSHANSHATLPALMALQQPVNPYLVSLAQPVQTRVGSVSTASRAALVEQVCEDLESTFQASVNLTLRDQDALTHPYEYAPAASLISASGGKKTHSVPSMSLKFSPIMYQPPAAARPNHHKTKHAHVRLNGSSYGNTPRVHHLLHAMTTHPTFPSQPSSTQPNKSRTQRATRSSNQQPLPPPHI